MMTITHYDVLGVSNDATPEDIKRAWRQKSRMTHPDTAPSESAGTLFSLVQSAYEVLSDEASRAEYDRTLDGTSDEYAEDLPARGEAWGEESTWGLDDTQPIPVYHAPVQEEAYDDFEVAPEALEQRSDLSTRPRRFIPREGYLWLRVALIASLIAFGFLVLHHQTLGFALSGISVVVVLCARHAYMRGSSGRLFIVSWVSTLTLGVVLMNKALSTNLMGTALLGLGIVMAAMIVMLTSIIFATVMRRLRLPVAYSV
jgi:DnaJ domain